MERYLRYKEKGTVCKYMYILCICTNTNTHLIWAISIDVNIHVSKWLVLLVPIRKALFILCSAVQLKFRGLS